MTFHLFNGIATPKSEGDLLCWPEAISVGVEMTPEEEQRASRAFSSMRLLALQNFAIAYPHECHAKWPWRFWILFHNMLPYVSRERMKELLEETK